jgi:hypothetical protein
VKVVRPASRKVSTRDVRPRASENVRYDAAPAGLMTVEKSAPYSYRVARFGISSPPRTGSSWVTRPRPSYLYRVVLGTGASGLNS